VEITPLGQLECQCQWHTNTDPVTGENLLLRILNIKIHFRGAKLHHSLLQSVSDNHFLRCFDAMELHNPIRCKFWDAFVSDFASSDKGRGNPY
jgi:hypothetical protein